MTTRFVASTLDLSTLAAPAVIKSVDYETILAARLADLVSRAAAVGITIDTTSLESEPGVILEQTDAYREMLTLSAINDAARSVMLAFATGTDLDHLAAFYDVVRLTITAATSTTAAVMEGDDSLRLRCQLAPEQLPYAGMTGGGYRALALRVAPSVKDVQTIKSSGGRVAVILLGRDGDGAVSDGVVTTVYSTFQDDDATQLTDVITVRPAAIVHYAPTITIKILAGPDPATVQAAALTAVQAYATSRHKIGLTVYAQMLESAASVGGVESAACDISDVVPGEDGAAYMTGATIVVQVIG